MEPRFGHPVSKYWLRPCQWGPVEYKDGLILNNMQPTWFSCGGE